MSKWRRDETFLSVLCNSIASMGNLYSTKVDAYDSARAIASDWSLVGDDLCDAMEDAERDSKGSTGLVEAEA
jgi:hypothetical protein